MVTVWNGICGTNGFHRKKVHQMNNLMKQNIACNSSLIYEEYMLHYFNLYLKIMCLIFKFEYEG